MTSDTESIPSSTTEDARPQFTPRPFGRYYLIDKIAIGGMAEVFKASFLGIHGFEMSLVLKRILPSLSNNQTFVDMFVNEAKIYAALQHQNIVQIYDFNKVHDNYFIALEFVEGRDLKTYLHRLTQLHRPLQTELAIFIAHQICNGLEFAHTQVDENDENMGLVHRDLSPANILISYNGEVKIADFGIAKAKMHAEITDSGVLKGKYQYMSPEQARGEKIDHRSDIFAVGILLYEMLTGTRLFKTDSDTETLEKVRNCNFEEPRKKNPSISPRLNQIIMRALHQSSSGRFQSAHDVQQALTEYLLPISVAGLAKELSADMKEVFATDRTEDRKRWAKNKQVAIELEENHDDDGDHDNMDVLVVPTPDTPNTSKIDASVATLQELQSAQTTIQQLYMIIAVLVVAMIALWIW